MTKARDLANVASNATDAANAIPDTLVDAKGDLIVASAADTVLRLGIGTNDQVLTADSSTTSGVKWAALPASGMGGLTLLNSGNTSVGTGSSKTWSSLTSYQNYIVYFDNVKGTNNANYRIEFSDGTTTVSWVWAGLGIYNNSSYSAANFRINSGGGTDLTVAFTEADSGVRGWVHLLNANTTGKKYAEVVCGNTSSAPAGYSYVTKAYENTSTTNAISQILVAPSAGTFTSGNVYIWGA